MTEQALRRQDETEVRALYHQLLGAWNQRDPRGYAALFDENGGVVGFDGSLMSGPAEIEATLGTIFADHQTAAYYSIIREVRFLAPQVALLRAVAGMVPPGKKDINPAVNAIQTLVAVKHAYGWRITLFQNTPAQFHGRPELAQQLTDELRKLI